ncbi:hypothetical protein GCM10027568_12110 [Humibacter soli]
MISVDTPGFITPPPGLIPPRENTGTHTERMPQRTSLPTFNAPAPNEDQSPAPRTWLVVLPTGARVPVDGALLVGRNPVRFEPWTEASLLPVDDPARSVSKTHAVIETVGDGVRVTDLHSTNGVSATGPEGTSVALAPGEAFPVDAGAIVMLGSYRVQLIAG